ncbi:MAG: hypothetical protein IJK81_05180 [Selenomonadaceae bacterium]|nr:hypothetical protein [Selenomonadaceae bacterium]
MDLIVGSGEKAVKVAGLKSVDAENFSAFDGITLTLEGGAVENFSDLTITGGANNVRRVIWQGEVDGVQRNAVLIVDNDGDGTLKGGWLILGNEQNVLTYYTDAAKISVEEDAAITLQFPNKKAALTPRRFTFIEKTSAGDGAILSIGAAFDDVTISAGATNPIYLSRTVNGSKLNGVLQPLATAQVNSEKWSFNDADSFIVEDGKKVFRGTGEFACDSELAACEIRFGKVLSETTAIKIADS